MDAALVLRQLQVSEKKEAATDSVEESHSPLRLFGHSRGVPSRSPKVFVSHKAYKLGAFLNAKMFNIRSGFLLLESNFHWLNGAHI